jgi:hypothetical protein
VSGRSPIAVLLGVVAIAAGVTLWWYAGRASGPEPLAIAAVEGDVVRVRDDRETPGAVGMSLAPGDRLVTGDDGSATLTRGAGTSVEVSPNTTVELAAIEDGLVEVRVEGGRVRARARPDAGAVRVLAAGREALAYDASFGLAVDHGSVSIETERGRVVVGGVPGVSEVQAGSRLHVFPDGEAVLRPVSDALLLDVAWPEPVRVGRVKVAGTTEPGATVRLVAPVADAGEPVRADAEGRFELELPVPEGRTEIEVAVRDPFGRERTARGVVQRVPEAKGAPTFRIELEYRR